jgi:hypothetical protein
LGFEVMQGEGPHINSRYAGYTTLETFKMTSSKNSTGDSGQTAAEDLLDLTARQQWDCISRQQCNQWLM